jgi:hypothetical protein
MMGKFTPQLRELPGAVDLHAHAPLAESRPPQIPAAAPPQPAAAHGSPAADPDLLRAAQAILEREVVRPDLAPAESEAVREVLYGLRERNLPRVSSIFREAFAELRTPSDAMKKAYEHLDRYFSASRRSTS